MQSDNRQKGRLDSMSRRAFAGGLAGCLLAPLAMAQASGIRLRRLHCFEIRVSDVERSVDFYQSLFGMPVQARVAGRVCLTVGEGPEFMAIRGLEDGEVPAITQIGYSVEDFELARTLSLLERAGYERIDAPPVTVPGIGNRMKTWVRERGEAAELFFADARGLIVQLSDPAWCGGSGADGTRCTREAAPEGLIRLQELNHFTVFVSDGAEANRYYQETFGLEVQAYQGPQSPVTGIGDGRQFVMYAGGRGTAAPTPANIHHGSFNIPDFDVDRVLATLTGFGLSAREGNESRPLMHYISRRMPNRGGAEGGTPELYFTDPDGVLLQLQDLSYCGGGGYLGNECLARQAAG